MNFSGELAAFRARTADPGFVGLIILGTRQATTAALLIGGLCVERVAFLLTDETRTMPEDVASLLGRDAVEWFCPAGDHSTTLGVYEGIRTILEHWADLDNKLIAVDVTGGQRAMTVGVERAALLLGLTTIYIQSDYNTMPDGRFGPKPGTQQLIIPPTPYAVFGDIANDIPLFESNNIPINSDHGSIDVQFDFPEEVKVACQQYLLYFVDFLRDVGIEATAVLREKKDHVLFSVTPRDKDEALDHIREALDIYLYLPMNRNTPVVVTPETSIEVQKLSAQLSFLQSQFYLANAALQQKELTIRDRDTTIQHQRLLIEQHLASGQLFRQALQEKVSKTDDAEPIGTDLVKIKQWSPENIPVEIDLPKLLRRLKEKFSRKRLP